MYSNGGWQNIVINFRFRESEDGGYQLEHQPIGFERWIIVHSGNSVELGTDELPITQQYQTSIGAASGNIISLEGGEF